MLPELLPGENLEDRDHLFHEIYRRWNVNHTAELEEEPKQCANEKEEENRKNKEDKLEIEGNR